MEQVPDTFDALFFGYSVMWGLIVLYVASLARRVSKLEKSSSAQE